MEGNFASWTITIVGLCLDESPFLQISNNPNIPRDDNHREELPPKDSLEEDLS